MKRACIICLSFLINMQVAIAQTLKIAELYIPTAPGFVLADKSPASIEKPGNPRAFGITLLTLREGGSIQFTPYWFFNHPAYSFSDYFKQKIPLLQTLNFSVATFKTDTNTVISAGLKTQLLRIYSNSVKQNLETLRKRIIDLLSVENLDKAQMEEIEKLRKKMNTEKSRTAFNFEFAAAINSSSKSFSFSDLSTERSGLWANMRFRPQKFPLDLTGLFRYSWARSPKSRFLDYGLALSFQQPSFDLELEYVYRKLVSLNKKTDRLSFVINYMVTDEIVIVSSIGKNFNKVGNLLTVFGVKFGISTERAKL